MSSVGISLSQKSKSQGICPTCGSFPECTYIVNADKPLFECDYFDRGASAQPVNIKIVTTRKKDGNNGSNGIAGICTDCQKHTACDFPKPELGIWECNNYAN